MSTILYYSNGCRNCQQLLHGLAKSKVKDDIHFLCIDKRIKGNNGATYLVLENNQQVLLPPNITKVPALLLLNRGNHVLFGEEIQQFFRPQEQEITTKATNNNMEPMAFGLNEMSSTSDSYSYLDQSPEEMSAKGDGGLRQMHNYATIDWDANIETPPDSYQPDKIGSVSMEQLQQQRNSEIQMPNQRRI